MTYDIMIYCRTPCLYIVHRFMLNASKTSWPRLFSGKFHRVSSLYRHQINIQWVNHDVSFSPSVFSVIAGSFMSSLNLYLYHYYVFLEFWLKDIQSNKKKKKIIIN